MKKFRLGLLQLCLLSSVVAACAGSMTADGDQSGAGGAGGQENPDEAVGGQGGDLEGGRGVDQAAGAAPQSGGSDGGTPSDVASNDAAKPPAGAVASDDFESMTLGAITSARSGWYPTGKMGTISISDVQAHSGTQSLRFESRGDGHLWAGFKTAGLFPTQGYNMFGRVWVFAEKAAAATGGHRHGFFQMRGESPRWKGVDAAFTLRADGARVPSINYFSNPPWIDAAGNAVKSPPPYPAASWFCMEWQFDEPKGQIRFYRDGNASPWVVIDRKGGFCGCNASFDPWVFPQLEEVRLGIYDLEHQKGALAFFFDDFALGAERLGCE